MNDSCVDEISNQPVHYARTRQHVSCLLGDRGSAKLINISAIEPTQILFVWRFDDVTSKQPNVMVKHFEVKAATQMSSVTHAA